MHTLAHCCLMSVCCAPGTEEQKNTLGAAIDKEFGPDGHRLPSPGDGIKTLGGSVAEWIDQNGMALVPKELAVTMHEIFAEAMTLRKGNR